MSFKPSPLCLALSGAITLTLAACGGGGSSPSATTSDSFTLPGTSAYGAPYPDGSEVTVTDAAGAPPFTGKVQGGAGAYAVEVKKSAKAPFVVQVSSPDLPTLVSVSTDAQPARINVTPITNLIAATLSPSGDPQKLAQEIKGGTASVTAATLEAKKTEVKDNILKPVTSALGDTTDPISGVFEIGKGHDLVLEAVKIQVQPVSDKASTISVSVKSSTPVDLPPVTLGSGGSTSLPKLSDALTKNNVTLSSDTLVKTDVPTQIAALLERMNACYALPTSERIKTGGTTAADIVAPACKSMFLDNDPAKFLSNSKLVSSTGSFSSIFGSGPAAQGVKFFLPSYEYTVKTGNTNDANQPKDGDVVFTAKALDGVGNSDIYEFWARPDATGKLFLSGNRSELDIGVSPRAEFREFLNLSGKDFYATGYNLFVNAKHNYAKVVVTSPSGNTITLFKRVGYDFFVIGKDASNLSTTSWVRLAGSYKSNGQSPRADFSGFVWGGSADLSDAELAAIPLQGTWTFELYANAADATPAATAKRRTLQRAPTLAELRVALWPSIFDANRSEIRASSAATGYVTLNDGDLIRLTNGDKDDQPFWTVPPGAWSPTNVTVYGRNPGNNTAFSDDASFPSSARLAVIRCVPTGTADTHCGSSPGTYAQGMQLSTVQWVGRNSRLVQMAYSVDVRKQ